MLLKVIRKKFRALAPPAGNSVQNLQSGAQHPCFFKCYQVILFGVLWYNTSIMKINACFGQQYFDLISFDLLINIKPILELLFKELIKVISYQSL